MATAFDDVAEAPRMQQPDKPRIDSTQLGRNNFTRPKITNPDVNYQVHTFYYPWYGNPEFNKGEYFHWNHEVLLTTPPPHPRFEPPDDVGANFYPELGCYSSIDEQTIRAHMEQLIQAKIGTLCISWYPNTLSDDQISQDQGYSDRVTDLVMAIAQDYGIKVNFHVEPYKGRNGASLKRDIEYIVKKYSGYTSFYRDAKTNRPMFYVYDSYLQHDWKDVLLANAPNTIRNTPIDADVIGLLVERRHMNELHAHGFDGVYSYFATDAFTYGSSVVHWRSIKKLADDLGLKFIPSVGPGYLDTRIRPWNQANARERKNGEYYEKMFAAACELNPAVLSITSFNEWHEGTQIEPAIAKTGKDGFVYETYGKDPHMYLKKTRELITRLYNTLRNPKQ